MIPISVIIISRNEGHIIEKTLQSLQGLTDDIILVDSGSTDDTLAIAKRFQTKVMRTTWDGYGANKNKGISIARYNWILSLDADEIIDSKLYQSLSGKTFFNENIVYQLKFNVFIGNVLLKHGQPGNVKKIRIFNKKKISWNNDLVHEALQIPDGIKIEQLPGRVLHYSYKNIDHCISKTNAYTSLIAQQMFNSGRHSSNIKLYLNPFYTFFRNYILKLGFLDGFWGYTYARMNSYYCYLKYAKLLELNRKEIIELTVEEKYSLTK